MIKKIFRPIYVPLFSYYNKLRYFIAPNLWSKAELSYPVLPDFQQKTFITGQGKIKIGKGCTFGFKPGGFHHRGSVELQARTSESCIIIGNNVKTNNNIFICACGKIIVGNNTLIGQGVCIMDFEAHGTHPLERSKLGEIGTVEIGENVWIGNGVTNS